MDSYLPINTKKLTADYERVQREMEARYRQLEDMKKNYEMAAISTANPYLTQLQKNLGSHYGMVQEYNQFIDPPESAEDLKRINEKKEKAKRVKDAKTLGAYLKVSLL